MLRYGISLLFRCRRTSIECRDRHHLRQMGVEFRCGVEVGKDVTLDELREEGYKAFYVAGRPPGRPPSRYPGRGCREASPWPSTSCARSTAARSTRSPAHVVVVGGGNAAIDVARTADRLGAEQRNVLPREARRDAHRSDEKNARPSRTASQSTTAGAPEEIHPGRGRPGHRHRASCAASACVTTDGKFAPEYDENDTITVSLPTGPRVDRPALRVGRSAHGTKAETGRGQGAHRRYA